MTNLLFALIPLLATQPTLALPEAKLTWVDVVIYHGNPEAKHHEVLSRPTIITRDRQEALVSIGQLVALNQSGERIQQVQLEEVQVGLVVQITPTWRDDGRISLKACITMTELVDNFEERSQTREIKTRCNTLCQPGEKVTIPLYNVNDYQDTLIIRDLAGNETRKVIKKPYTGCECWVELVVREYDSKKYKLPAEPPVTVDPGTGIPRAVPAGR